MNLEGPKSISSEGTEKDIQNIESFFGKYLRCFKRWGLIGVSVGAFFISGEMLHQQKEKDREYDAYIISSMSTEEIKIREKNKAEIFQLFGNDAVQDIELGNREAFFERKSGERQEPKIKGFSERGWGKHVKYALTEKYLYYPKGWINGEIGMIEFINSIKNVSATHNLGGKVERKFFSKPAMYLYRAYNKKTHEEGYVPIPTGIEDHEFGHANDWETDMDLNILDRQVLLLKIHQRLTAPNSWHRVNDPYHEIFIDGSKEGFYQSAREYWAEICTEYFTNPELFLINYPEDFKIVDTQAKKNDPSFDIFNKDRGAFDTQTGKLKDVWKDK